MKSFSVSAFFTALVLFAVSAHAENEFHLSGRVYDDTYFSTQNLYGKSLEQENISAWLQVDAKLNDNYYFRAIYKGDGFEANNSAIVRGASQTTWMSDWREAYGEYRQDSLIVRAGKQIIAWGKSDGVNPTDYFSAHDYSYLNPDDEVRRISGLALLLSFTPDAGGSPWTFTFVSQFMFPQGLALIPPALIPNGITIGGAPQYAVNFDNTEYGFKTNYSGRGWDASLSLFRGFNHQEQFSLTQYQLNGSNLVANFSQIFNRVLAVGVDGSKNFGKWVARLEGAYFRTDNDSALNMLSIPSHLDAVAGIERPVGDDFRISGQLLIRYFPNYSSLTQAIGPDLFSQQLNLQLASANALLLQYQDRTRPSGSLRLAWAPGDTDWSAEVFYIYSCAGGDYLVRPQVNYRPIDNFKLTLGSDNYGGDPAKPLGSLKPYNSVYFEAKYDF